MSDGYIEREIMKRTVSEKFRDRIFEKFPPLRDEFCGHGAKYHCQNNTKLCSYVIPFRSMIEYLFFGNKYCEETGRLMIPHYRIKSFCGVSDNDNNWKSESFLQQFRMHILNDFVWSEYGFGKSRTVIHNGFDQEVLDLLVEENDVFTPNEVFFISGNKYNSTSSSKQKRENYNNFKINVKDIPLNETQKIIFDYMNGQDGKALSRKLSENMELISQEVEKLPRTIDPDKDEIVSRYDRAKRILSSITEDCRVVYFPSRGGRTPRLHASEESVIALPKEIRKALCKGWSEIDLKSSQFAIISAYLGAEEANKFISGGGDIWQSFYETTHGKYEQPPAKIKGIYKECIYGICFGKTERESNWTKKTIGVRPLEKILAENNMLPLLDHKIMRELLTLREEWYNRIIKNGGEMDCWGNWIGLHKRIDNFDRDRKPKHIAASIIQSIEMDIAKEMIVYVRDHECMQAKIVLWQHDGCTVSFQSKDKKQMCFENMQQSVMDKAKQYNVMTQLEMTDL